MDDVFVEKMFELARFMKAPKVNVSIGRKFNLGNFESIDIHVSVSRDVDPNNGDNVDTTMIETANEAWLFLQREARNYGITDVRIERILKGDHH